MLQISDTKPLPGRGLRLLVHRSQTDPLDQGQDMAVWADSAEFLLCPMVPYNASPKHQTSTDRASRAFPIRAVTKAGSEDSGGSWAPSRKAVGASCPQAW